MSKSDANGIFVAEETDVINPFHSYLNAAFGSVSSAISAMLPPGAIIAYAGNKLPTGWYWCDGSWYSSATDKRLYDAIGNTYGTGDGSSGSFAVPDLRQRVPVGATTGPLSGGGTVHSYKLGAKGGAEKVTLTVEELPQHTHPQVATSDSGVPIAGEAPTSIKTVVTNSGSYNRVAHGTATLPAGGNQSHENMPPYLAIGFIIKR